MAFLFFTGNAIAKEDQEGIPLDIEFLEFLGGWETNDGQWVDPLSLDPDPENMGETEILESGRLSGGEEDDPSFLKEGTHSKGERDEDG